MSYKISKWIKLENIFSWWYVDNTASFQLEDNKSPFLRNARLEWKSIKIRPWHSLFATLTAWSFPKWTGSYLRTLTANDRIIVRHAQDTNKELVTITSAWVVTDISTSTDITSTARMTFLNVWDVIYCMNWSDDFWKLSATTYTTPSTWIANFAPSFGVDFSSSHWASGWSTNPSLVYKSVWNDYEDFNSAGSDQFEFQEQVTSLSDNNKTLLVFTPSSISTIDLWDFDQTNWRVTYKTDSVQAKEWTDIHATTVTVWANTFYFTPSKKINRLTRWQSNDWFETYELSERPYKGISKIMSTLDDTQDDAFGYYVPKDNLIKWFFKTLWSSINNICIVYDIEKDAFLIDEQKFFYDWTNFKGKNYTISTVEPKVYEDEVNQDDEDAWIPFEYNTKDYTLWDPTRKKILWETRCFTKINELAELKQEILVDGRVVDTKIIDKDNIELFPAWIWVKPVWTFAIWTWWFEDVDDLEEVTILRTKWSLNIKWKKIRFRYTCDTLAGKAQLEDLQMRVEILPELTNNLTK